MPELALVPSECKLCQKPLGADSKAEGFVVCHDHRRCHACGLELNPRELTWCFDRYCDGSTETPIIVHPRCSVLDHKDDITLAIKQSEYDYLNLIRLMVVPDMSLSHVANENNAMAASQRLITEMDFEQRYIHLKMMEACVTQLSIVRSRKDLRVEIDKREQKRIERARKEDLTSSRSTGTIEYEPKELALGEFMKNFGISSRKVALKLQSQRDKVTASFTALGISATQAKAQADKMLLGNIKSGKQKISED